MQRLGMAIVLALFTAGIMLVAVYSGGASMGWDEDLLSTCVPASALVGGVMGFAIGLGVKFPTTCPYCKETIKPDATVCKHCGRDIPPSEEGE